MQSVQALKIPHPPASMAKYRSSSSGDGAVFKRTQAYNLDKW